MGFFNKDNWSIYDTDGYEKTKPDISKKHMLDYINKHFRYWTLNSWNRSSSFANCVKLQNLGLDEENIDFSKALDFVSSCNDDFNIETNDLIRDFENEFPGFTAGFNGRQSGYIVLYNSTYPGRSVCSDIEEIEDDDDEIFSVFKLLKAFDTLCDSIRDIFIDYVRKYHTQTIKLYRPETISVSYPADTEPDNEEYTDLLNEYPIYVMPDIKTNDYVASMPALDIYDIRGDYLEDTMSAN